MKKTMIFISAVAVAVMLLGAAVSVKFANSGMPQPSVESAHDQRDELVSALRSEAFDYDFGREGQEPSEEKVFQLYLKSAELGHTGSMLDVAERYLEGEGVEKDVKKAEEWYIRAAETGQGQKMERCGDFYRLQAGEAGNPEKAVYWYRKAADAGESSSMLWMGRMYETGKGVAQDDKQAVLWYRRAAENGVDRAKMKLAEAYEHGRGVEQSDRWAVFWYRSAAERRTDYLAQYRLGTLYEQGRLFEKNPAEAAQWYRRSGEEVCAPAMFRLGLLYLKGEGVVKSTERGVELISAAAYFEYPHAQLYLGRMHMFGEWVKQDVARALKYYRMASNCEVTEEWDEFESDVYGGDAVEDIKRAKELLTRLNDPAVLPLPDIRRKAEARDAQAMYNLGMCYLHGYGVKIDATTAQGWLRHAYQAGHLGAGVELALTLSAVTEKLELLSSIAEQENLRAMVELGKVYRDPGSPKYDLVKAAQLFRRAAEDGNAEGMLCLGECYEYGQGVEKDEDLAEEWYMTAMECYDDAIDKRAREALRRMYGD